MWQSLKRLGYRKSQGTCVVKVHGRVAKTAFELIMTCPVELGLKAVPLGALKAFNTMKHNFAFSPARSISLPIFPQMIPVGSSSTRTSLLRRSRPSRRLPRSPTRRVLPPVCSSSRRTSTKMAATRRHVTGARTTCSCASWSGATPVNLSAP